MAEPQEVLCVDGVLRRDTPEQAAIRARKTHALRNPEKFAYKGQPYTLGKRKGSPNAFPAQAKRSLMESWAAAGLKCLERSIAEAEATYNRLTKNKVPQDEIDEAKAAHDALVTQMETATPHDLTVLYLTEKAIDYPKSFMTLIGRLLPQQHTIDDRRSDVPSNYTSAEIVAFYARVGLPPPTWVDKIKTIEQVPAERIDGESREDV